MIYFKKMFKFMRPYIASYSIGIFLYNSQGFASNLAIGLIGRNILAGIMSGSTNDIITGALFALITFIVLFSLVGLGIYLGNRALLYAIMDLKQKLFRCFMKTDLETSQSSHSGEGIAAINTEANTAANLYWNAASSLLNPIITATFSAATLFIIDFRMGFAAVGLGIFTYFTQSRFIKPLAKIGKERLDVNANTVKDASDIFQGAVSIRAFNMQDTVLENSTNSINRLKILDFRQAFISMWQTLFTTVQGWLALAVTFGFGGWLVATGRLDFPALLLVLPLIQGVSSDMGNIGQAIAGLQPPLEAAKRVFAIMDNVPASKDNGIKEFNSFDIKIDGLNFKYKNAEQNTLNNINLDIAQGEMVAFVGPSGSGKSTLLRVMVGFYERDDLSMILGGTSSNNANFASWRNNFAYVDQSCKLFDMSIKENISMGCKGKVDNSEIIEASKRAFAHGFIEQLEEKYDSSCGEKGASLSGGQKQRIAIARALVKGSKILVFDEATSALDADSERYVMETIESLRNDHTILITTHNLSNIITADKIVVMDNGIIIEVGKHDDLLAQKGLYHELFTKNLNKME